MSDVINQFKEAEVNGEQEIILILPRFNSDDNWPLSNYIGERMSKALKRQKVLDTYIVVKDFKLSEEKNKQFNISSEK